MRKIELTVSTGRIHRWLEGGEDTAKFVAVVEIPPFPDEGLPEVVIWGSRTFMRASPGGDRPVYAEVFAVMSLTPPPGFER